jgi:hypothetical protein
MLNISIKALANLFLKHRKNELEEKISYLQAQVANLEMQISPLTFDCINRIKWVARMLQPQKINFNFVRIGNQGDGGYVLVTPLNCRTALSLGVGDQISADLELINKYNIDVYAFDPFVNRPVGAPNEFIFHKVGLKSRFFSAITDVEFKDLNGIISEIGREPDLALIDIEGSEWELIHTFDLLSNTSQLVIEYHWLEKIIDDDFYATISGLIKKISLTHIPVHVHGNNDGPTIKLPGASWPGIIEVTYIRKDLAGTEILEPNYGPWPTKLDSPNSPKRPDLLLDPFFGASATYRAEVLK